MVDNETLYNRIDEDEDMTDSEKREVYFSECDHGEEQEPDY